ncbi:hypothetical protein L0657_11225 [Dyadobacter sp. CY345]|uniref:STN and carboxypeptidase regulatory-like domain-containing protein n=1 Tax=Dyadobacter sp. CY345 TaxID=2909335 RepID=UPI001F39B55A|nr:STN and carboxypeptidase regulatory-like domain-containing protein [Dyadobacter sp. CY345]MCF2444529.1 hypothetical protein [Dyadobacter sp. CY345]
MKKLYPLSLLFLVNFFFATPSFAQELLERKISIRVTNQPVDEVLQQIGNLGGFSFSYSPDVIDIKNRVSVNVSNKSVREILNELFKGKVIFKQRHRYIILQKNQKAENEVPSEFNLNGYIIDKNTGDKLANASIYEPVTLASTISNQFGYYKIQLPTAPTSVRLEIRKEQYVGKTIIISNRKNTYLPITLNPDTLKVLSARKPNIPSRAESTFNPKIEIPQIEYTTTTYVLPDTIIEKDTLLFVSKLRGTYQRVRKDFSLAFASAKQAINTRNITDTLYRPVQTSILPFMSTNRELSGNVVNDYSFNVFAGYSLGTNILEIGGFINADRGHVKGVQLAGIANVVGHNVTGFQYATALNVVMGNVKGFQYSTLLNFTGGNFKGVQLAGVGNVLLGDLNGWQISGAYNYAKTVKKGHQLSIFNYADSSATAPIGFFSYVRKNGYRRYEISTDEFNYFNTSFKTGVNAFYNIFTVGFNGMVNNKPLGSIGYGFGTGAKLGRGWMWNADITINVVAMNKDFNSNSAAGLFRLNTSIERNLGNRLSIAFGPSINILAGNNEGTAKDDRTFLSTIWLGGKPDKAQKDYAWVGFLVAIRLRDKL